MDIIQGGPTPIVVASAEASAAFKAADQRDKEPVKSVKPAARTEGASRYAQSKLNEDSHRGRRVNIEA